MAVDVTIRDAGGGELDMGTPFGKDLLDLARRAEHSLKGFLTPGMLFEAFGFDYVGPIDGHRFEDLKETLRNAMRIEGPVLIHVLTKKGKGYAPAENDPARFHGIGPFDQATGASREVKGGPASYTGVFGRTLIELAEQDPRIVAVGETANLSPRFVFHHAVRDGRLRLFHGDGLALKTAINLKANRRESRLVVDLDTFEGWALQGTVEEFAPHQHPEAFERICQGFAAGNWGKPSRVFRHAADTWQPIAPV